MSSTAPKCSEGGAKQNGVRNPAIGAVGAKRRREELTEIATGFWINFLSLREEKIFQNDALYFTAFSRLAHTLQQNGPARRHRRAGRRGAGGFGCRVSECQALAAYWDQAHSPEPRWG